MMRVLIKGAGDLATGVGAVLHEAGYQVVMTEIEKPLTVRRQVAFSSAVYEKETVVEGIRAVLAEGRRDVLSVLEEGNIAVVVDPDAKIRSWYQPHVIVDAVMAKKNIGTRREDAQCVIALGPGFTAGADCHAVIETMRGATLGEPIYEGSAIADTGIPGMVGGYAKERLIKASADGEMKSAATFGSIVKKGEVIAYTGGKPVYAQIDGIIRGMLMDGLLVKEGMKIGDVDPRGDQELVYRISDKSWKIGRGVLKAIHSIRYGDYAFILLAAGQSRRYGKNKLLDLVHGKPMFMHTADRIHAFEGCLKVCVSRFDEIEAYAAQKKIEYAENTDPGLGISHSLKLGLTRCLERNPNLKGAMFVVADQPSLSCQTLEKIMEEAKAHPGMIVCAGSEGEIGNPVFMDCSFFKELLLLEGDVGGKQVIKQHPDQVFVCEIPGKELQDIDFQKVLDR